MDAGVLLPDRHRAQNEGVFSLQTIPGVIDAGTLVAQFTDIGVSDIFADRNGRGPEDVPEARARESGNFFEQYWELFQPKSAANYLHARAGKCFSNQ